MVKIPSAFALLLILKTISCFNIMEENNFKKKSPEKLREKLHEWLFKIVNGTVPKYCSGRNYDNINEDEIIVRSVPCSDPRAVDR